LKLEVVSLQKNLDAQRKRCEMAETKADNAGSETASLRKALKALESASSKDSSKLKAEEERAAIADSKIALLEQEVESGAASRVEIASLQESLETEREQSKQTEIKAENRGAKEAASLRKDLEALESASMDDSTKLQAAEEGAATAELEIARLRNKLDAGTKLCRTLAAERATLRSKLAASNLAQGEEIARNG